MTNNFAEKTAEKRRAKFDAYLKVMSKIIYPTGRIFSLEFKFCYIANGKIAKFKFRFLLSL